MLDINPEFKGSDNIVDLGINDSDASNSVEINSILSVSFDKQIFVVLSSNNLKEYLQVIHVKSSFKQ